ncbi:hypothetical protein BYT27DRAFT_7197141 [Phlegmacium glaucopus]|nr:hypothetical protein BYT27DRAFT_7197141 [Phlegmacium glaucopus]
MSASTTKPSLQSLPTDPDDDDLDELDDVLAQFTPGQKTTNASQPEVSSQISSTSSLPPPPPPPTASTATTFRRPRHNTRVDALPTSNLGSTNLDTTLETEEELDFARELAKGMENLMRELSAEAEGSTGAASTDDSGSSDPSAESARALKAVWEQMLIEGMDGNPGTGQFSGNETSTGGGGGGGSGGGFQDKIKQAVNKLKESESNLQANGKSPNDGGAAAPNAESLEALLSSLGDFGLGEGGDDKELAGLLEGMVGELMSKSILYEPLSELAQGFPPYLENPPSPLSDEDRKRYDLQLGCVRRILAVFDQAGYDDKDPGSQQQIADLMAEMQNYGTPPSELMGPLPDEGCSIT